MKTLLRADPMDLWLFTAVLAVVWALGALAPMLLIFGERHLATILVCAGPIGALAGVGFLGLLASLLVETWRDVRFPPDHKENVRG